MAVEHDPPAAYDDLNVRSIALVGGVGSVLVFVAIVAVQVIFFRYNEQEYQEKVLAVPARQADTTLAAQRERLLKAGPGADAEKGEKSIPIEQAMAAVVDEYRRRRSTEAEPSAETESPAATEESAPEPNAASPEAEPAEAKPEPAEAEQPAAE